MRRGVDFDGTLAFYEEYEGPDILGAPIPAMVERVKGWMEAGDETVIVTARVHPSSGEDAEVAENAIRDWCQEVFGQEFEVTCMKDPMMMEIWDDRGVRVVSNMGVISDQTDLILEDAVPGVYERADSIGKFIE